MPSPALRSALDTRPKRRCSRQLAQRLEPWLEGRVDDQLPKARLISPVKAFMNSPASRLASVVIAPSPRACGGPALLPAHTPSGGGSAVLLCAAETGKRGRAATGRVGDRSRVGWRPSRAAGACE